MTYVALASQDGDRVGVGHFRDEKFALPGRKNEKMSFGCVLCCWQWVIIGRLMGNKKRDAKLTGTWFRCASWFPHFPHAPCADLE